MAALRYLLFATVGVVIASALFLILSFIVSTNIIAVGTGFVERWIVRATCDQYELTGSIRDATGRPVPFAVIEAAYFDERLTTRSNTDGTFALVAAEAVCDRRPPANVALIVVADNFRPKRLAVPFETGSLEVTLDSRDFRP